jgi:hypothetical protein
LWYALWFIKYFLISYYDLFLHIPGRCRRLILYLITLSVTHKISRNALDEKSARNRDFYLTTHTTITRDRNPC